MGILFDLKGQVNLADIFNLNSTCCIVSIAVNSLVHHFAIQPYPVTTLIHDLGFPIVHKKLSKGFVLGLVLVHGLLTKACLQATNQGLSTGYQPRLLCRLPNKAYPQATNQGLFIGYQPRLVHRLLTKGCPQATNQGLSAGYQLELVHRLPTKVCPQATDQDLSTGYQPRLVHRLSTKACPQATNQGWSTGYQPRLVHRLPTKACSQLVHTLCTTGHQPRPIHLSHCPWILVHRPQTEDYWQTMYQPWITGISNAISNSYISKLILHQVLLAYDACLYPQSISWIKSNQLVYKVTEIQCILT